MRSSRLWANPLHRDNRLDGISSRRLHAIFRYVADFCSPHNKPVIELDSEPHLHQAEADTERTEFLVSQGYTVLRFWNRQVMEELDSVLEQIRSVVKRHV